MSGAKKNAYAWTTLPLVVCFTERQKQMDKIKVNKLQELLEEQKIFTDVLVGMMNRLRDRQEWKGRRPNSDFNII